MVILRVTPIRIFRSLFYDQGLYCTLDVPGRIYEWFLIMQLHFTRYSITYLWKVYEKGRYTIYIERNRLEREGW